MRWTYYFSEGGGIYSCEYEIISGVEWKLAGSDKKIKECRTEEDAEEMVKHLNNGE